MSNRKIGRNEPCWCGSGKKYKQCHLGRGNEPHPKISDVVEESNKAFNKKMCLCPEEWKNNCDELIVRAHTVSRKMLEKISVDGHVYSLKRHLGAFVSDGGKLKFKKMGINKASVFTGFCSKHDSEIFNSIENERFEITKKNAFLLAYRAFCYECFTKNAALETIPLTRQLDKGRTIPEQAFHQSMVHKLKIGFETAIRDQKVIKKQYDKMLISKDFDKIKYYIVELDTLPSLMFSGCINPSFDLYGNRLQNLANLECICEATSISLVANDENRGLIVFAWLGSDDGPCDRFVRSYHKLTSYQKAQSVIRLAFEFLENKYLNIDWWDSLDKKTTDALNKRQEIALNVFEERKADCLADDAIHYVDWKIIDFHTNIECN